MQKIAYYNEVDIEATGCSESLLYPIFVKRRSSIRFLEKLLDFNEICSQDAYSPDDIEKENTYNHSVEISYWLPPFLGLYSQSDWYGAGAAHPLADGEYRTYYDTTALIMSDILNENEIDIFNYVCINKLAADGADVKSGDSVKTCATAETNNFLLQPNGIRMWFPPYKMGPYAAGSFTVTVRFTDIADTLNSSMVRKWRSLWK